MGMLRGQEGMTTYQRTQLREALRYDQWHEKFLETRALNGKGVSIERMLQVGREREEMLYQDAVREAERRRQEAR